MVELDYLPTEKEIYKAMTSGNWPAIFAKDYSSIKRNVGGTSSESTANTAAIVSLTATVEGLAVDVDAAELALANHVAADTAHGVAGQVVGTLDFCTGSTGGVVLLAAAVTNANASTVAITGGLAAAGATYSQAYAQLQTDKINELCTDLTQVVTDLNATISKLNALLAVSRTAKQLAT